MMTIEEDDHRMIGTILVMMMALADTIPMDTQVLEDQCTMIEDMTMDTVDTDQLLAGEHTTVSGLGMRPTVVRQGGMQVAEATTSRQADLMQRLLLVGDDLNTPDHKTPTKV